MKYDQLNVSSKQWNQEDEVLTRYKDFYEKRSFTGDRLIIREKKLFQLLDSIKLKKNAKVLELGYGPGTASEKIVKRGYELYGIDISEYFCKIATERCRKVPNAKCNLIVGDAEKPNFEDNKFDVVTGVGFLQYLKDPQTCIDQAYRVLKPGGYLLIAQRNDNGIHSIDNPYHFTKFFIRIVRGSKYLFRYRHTFVLDLAIMFSKIFNLKRINRKLKRHKKLGTIKKNAMYYGRLKKMIEKSGFNIITTKGAGFYSRFWYRVLPDKLNKVLQKRSDKRKIPYKFANGLVFLAQKKWDQ